MNIGELAKFRAGINTDTINEQTAGSGVTIDTVVLKDGQVSADQINELTPDNGVAIDGVALKDGNIETVAVEQFTQQGSTPATPASGKTKFYVKNDSVAYLLGPDGIETPVGSGSTVERVTQATHGFAVGEVLYYTGTEYAKAQADDAATAEAVCMVSRVIDANTFEYVTNGIVEKAAWGLTAGAVYFLSDSTAGAITETEPSTVSYISKPLLIATSTTTGVFMNMRGQIIGGTNAFTNTALSNNAATTIYTITDAAGEAGMIQGRLKIVTSSGTNYTAWCGCSYTRQQDGTTYNVGGAFFDDAIPSGTYFDTSGSALRLVLPDVTNFSSAQLRWMRYG